MQGIALDRYDEWGKESPELAAHLAAHGSVLVCALIEVAIKALVVHRANRTGDAELKNYTENAVKFFRNPQYGDIKGLLGNFSKEYADGFSNTVPHDSKTASAIGSIVNNKNSLAHTGGPKANLTLENVRSYFDSILETLCCLEDILIPQADTSTLEEY